MTLFHQTIVVFVFFVCIVFLVGAYALRASSHADPVHLPIIRLIGPAGETETLEVEIADAPDERETGLMHRTVMPDGTGMLFVFAYEQVLSFWMKNTLIPLDIFFFDSNGRFVSRSSMIPCDQDPCALTPSGGLVQYALEVNHGEEKTAAVGDGWTLLR